jgi:hypothetical protein
MARIEIIVMWIEASGEEELALQVAPASSSSVQGHTDGVRYVARKKSTAY